MAYPTNSLALVLEDVDRRMIAIKSRATRDRDAMLVGNVFGSRIIDEHVNFKQEKSALQAAASTAGIAQYAKDMKNDQTLDVVAEFNAVIAAIDAVTDWIEANFPASGGFIQREQWNTSNGGTTDRSFTTAQTAQLVIELNALISAID